MIREVLLDIRWARGQVWLQINWQTGAVTEHGFRRSVLSYGQHADAVWFLRRAWGLPPVVTTTTTSLEPTHSEQIVSAEDAASSIGVWPTTFYKWLRLGRLRGVQVCAGLPGRWS